MEFSQVKFMAMREALIAMLEQFDHPGLQGLVISKGKGSGWMREHAEAMEAACKMARLAIDAPRARDRGA